MLHHEFACLRAWAGMRLNIGQDEQTKADFFGQALGVKPAWTGDCRWDRCASGDAGVLKRLPSGRVDKGGSGGQNENASLHV